MKIKATYLFLIALVCGLFTSCMDGDWDEPNFDDGAPFGNNSITEHNVISVRELIKRYPNVFAGTDQNTKITEDIQIKGRITGNDIGRNIYKQVMLQDATGAIIIAINAGGLNGYLAEGSEILVDLNGLYIGGYRKQPEIGAPYNGNSIGRMQKDIWDQHFKIVGDIDTTVIKAVDFNTVKDNMDENCAKLITLKGVTFKNADGKNTFTTGTASGNAVNQELTGMGSDVVIRTSTYAEFAAVTLPYDIVKRKPLAVDITGIATRYNNTWQILIRKTSDIKTAK